jgi:hypothetical protein
MSDCRLGSGDFFCTLHYERWGVSLSDLFTQIVSTCYRQSQPSIVAPCASAQLNRSVRLVEQTFCELVNDRDEDNEG